MERCGWATLQTSTGPSCLIAILSVCLVAPCSSFAQGVTTGTLRGIVEDARGAPLDAATALVVNTSNGYAVTSAIRTGTFVTQGLSTGAPYNVVVTKIGYVPQRIEQLYIPLGGELKVRFTLTAISTKLDTVRISASDRKADAPFAGGVGTTISDSLLQRLPSLNRDLYDFVRLVPQVSTRFGMSGGGANFRYNSYLIDGLSDRQLQGNNVMGGGTTGGKSISIDAVKEYQVLLSPYAPRYGDFTGLQVNAVTKSGTNHFRGSVYAYGRNASLARTDAFVGSSPYSREQFGLSIGGPIIRNRLHFFFAPEFQLSTAPASGPYIGQSATASSAVPVSEASVTEFASLLRAKGIEPGNGGRVNSLNPATTIFGRIDLAVPELKSRVVFLGNYSKVDVTRFSRPEAAPSFPLSSTAWTLRTSKKSSGLQIFSQLNSSVFNEFHLAYMDRPLAGIDFSESPSIQVAVPGIIGNTSAMLTAGTPPPAGASATVQKLWELADHVVLQRGFRNTISTGLHFEFFRYNAVGVRGMFGQWAFQNLDALAAGNPSTYQITRDFGSAESAVRGFQPSAYVSDEWRVNDRLLLTFGLRGDALNLSGAPAYNGVVDSVLSRKTSDYPASRIQWAPRFAFDWTPMQAGRTRISGGAGLFVGPPPLGWLLGPMRSDGAGIRTLSCDVQGRAPKFVAEIAAQPLTCADGRGFADGPVALVDRNLKMAESFRTSLSLDQRLAWNIQARIEALYSRVRSDFLFVNANLPEPRGVDAHGRVLYGEIDVSGRSKPDSISARFSEVIDLRNHSLGHSLSLTAQLSRPFNRYAELRAAYTRSRSRDVQSLVNASAVSPSDTWAGGRPLSGRHDVLTTGVSSFEVAHRAIFAATFTSPWKRWTSDLSIYFIGESGTPFTYGDSSISRLGDLNADGTSANDPIYVPRDARNPTEIAFAGADSVAQGAAFEKFIDDTPCLARQRGRILERNSCRGPWVNTSNASLRQSLGSLAGHKVGVQVDVFNFLNLLNPSWGLMRLPNQSILQHVGQVRGTPSQPAFRFDPKKLSSIGNLESGYQLQLSIRASF